jgi:hypothetical protein
MTTHKNEDPEGVEEQHVGQGSAGTLNVDELRELDSLGEAAKEHEPPVLELRAVEQVRKLTALLEHKQQPWLGVLGGLSLAVSLILLGGMVALLRLQVVATIDTPLSPSVAIGIAILVTMTAFLLSVGRRYSRSVRPALHDG